MLAITSLEDTTVRFLDVAPLLESSPFTCIAVHIMDSFSNGRYLILRKMGWGHFSTVWLAKDNQYVRPVLIANLSLQITHILSNPLQREQARRPKDHEVQPEIHRNRTRRDQTPPDAQGRQPWPSRLRQRRLLPRLVRAHGRP